MDIQKDRFMRNLTLLFLCFIFIACERPSLKRAENLLNFSLNNSVSFLQKHEYWNNFNGNGFRIEVYNILDMNYIRNMSEKSHLKSFNYNKKYDAIRNSECGKFINNGAGFYKTIWKGDNIETVVIDTLNKKFLFCYCLI
ncbi:hypothetical protein [Prevotella histicola]|jgi:hypothetical protein|uniref:hypothetical protein n=2 Tax=Prevotella histicola TaxID=470565 RepID=UPI001CB36DEF|nr:hypothetical protein [Prevotella histicola]MBF1418245.1 hypothetical protein [Prevotella histicola]